jgi:4-amino-4-deoxy-L-arabinose transferase-like glycosyltransferase
LIPTISGRVAPMDSPWYEYDFSVSIALLHAALGAGTAAMTAIAARRWGLSATGILVATLVVALDPSLILQSRAVMTEPLAAALLAWGLAASAGTGRRWAWETGLALGLAALCRPSTLAASALIVLAAGVRGISRRTVRDPLVIAGTILAVLAPWAIRNRLAFGEFVWTTTHGGYTLALANNEDYYRDVLDGPPGAVWDENKQRRWAERIAVETDKLSEPEADRRLASQGWRMLRERPRDFSRASLARVGRFWASAGTATTGSPSATSRARSRSAGG